MLYENISLTVTKGTLQSRTANNNIGPIECPDPSLYLHALTLMELHSGFYTGERGLISKAAAEGIEILAADCTSNLVFWC